MSAGSILQIDDVGDRPLVEDIADVVVIGSGAAGAAAARVLTGAGAEVVILEEGPYVPSSEFRSDVYSTFKRIWRDMGMQVARGRALTPVLQGSCVGGTTAINSAIVHRLPESVARQWRERYGIGDMLAQRELDRVFDQLERELFVDTAPEEVLGENSKLMRAGIEALGLTGNKIRRNVRGCRGSGHCNQGCPTGQRQSMNVSYVPRSVEAGARVFATCRAERIWTKNGRATGVTGRFRDRGTGRLGPTLKVQARHAVVVAASAIQTPLLLMASGIGRRSGLLGRGLQAHPGTGLVGIFDRPVKMWFGATQGYETMQFWDEGMKLETVGMPLELAAARLPGVGPDLMRELAGYAHVAIWGVELRARAEGRVRRGLLGGAAIHYDLTDEDVGTLKRAIRRLAETMFAAGAREVLPGIPGLPDRVRTLEQIDPLFAMPDDPRLFHTIAAHLFGTARMGTDPRAAVVGPALEAHDLAGLYVVDSSVFPTNIGVNPQLSISAVAWLAAERIAARIVG